MPGAIVQLVAYGIEDLYLTGDPQITFFKMVYRRHSNFAFESVIQNFNSRADFGESVTCTISRYGDLVGQIFLYVEIPSLPIFIDRNTGEEDSVRKMAWVTNLGYALIQDVTVEIGGKLIDRQYGEWMYIWSQVSNRQDLALDKMTGNIPMIYDFTNGKPGYKLYIPLEFWFCRHNGLALPLIALASSDVKINVTFRRVEECYRIGPTHSIEILEDIIPFNPGDYIEQTINGCTIYGYVIDYDYLQKKLYYIKICNRDCHNCFIAYHDINLPKSVLMNNNFDQNLPFRIYNSIIGTYCTPKPNCRENIECNYLISKPQLENSFLYVDYFYLDVQERNKFVSTSHEYLIEQIQFDQEIGITSPNVKQRLALNHPCKAIYWVAQLDYLVGSGTINDIFNYTNSHIRGAYNPCIGKSLVEKATLLLNSNKRFCNRSWQYFNFIEPYEHHYRGPDIGINVYSPALYPEDHQPSSAINMSKIDDISMLMRLNCVVGALNMARIRTYTINYNVLRICFGLGGLAFV